MSWKILTYHDVGFGMSSELVGLGGTVPPDVLAQHLAAAQSCGDVVSADEALRRINDGDDGSLITFWFDDGLRGVSRYALDIFASRGVSAAAAVCSRFYRRAEVFWRMKLAAVVAYGGASALRARFDEPAASLARSTMDRFSGAVLDAIDDAWHRVVPEGARRSSSSSFMDQDDIRALRDAGWTISNHTAAHYPVGEPSAVAQLGAQFLECEDALRADLGAGSSCWVLPFDRARDPQLRAHFRAAAGGRPLVLVGERASKKSDVDDGVIHRFSAPLIDSSLAIRALLRAN